LRLSPRRTSPKHGKRLDAAFKAESDLANLRQQQEEAENRVVGAFSLAGNAAYNDLQFDKARDSYLKALAHVDRNKKAQEWAAIQISIGNAERNLAARSEGTAIGLHTQSGIEAYRRALEVYTREQLPQAWAATQNNLGGALHDLAARSEGEKAAQYLAQAVDAFRNALQVRTREQLPEDWAMTQNTIRKKRRTFQPARRPWGPTKAFRSTDRGEVGGGIGTAATGPSRKRISCFDIPTKIDQGMLCGNTCESWWT
jgi:tetratricopeptide (TPR) repeat protein